MNQRVMTQVSDAERYAAAWRDRRRRFIVYVAEMNAFWILICGPLIFPKLLPERYILVFPAWFVGNIVAGVWLNRFRCPRCGNFYYWKWDWKWEFKRSKNWRDCRHCGLAQDAGPT